MHMYLFKNQDEPVHDPQDSPRGGATGAGQRTHCCVGCEAPIAVYGRCAPCLHVYCVTCASEMSQCYV